MAALNGCQIKLKDMTKQKDSINETYEEAWDLLLKKRTNYAELRNKDNQKAAQILTLTQ
jgi:hypothetical protein